MRGEPLVSVVVVTWNGLAHLRRLLPPLLDQRLPGGAGFEVLVVDNASRDGTGAYLTGLAARERRLRLLFNPRNEGFAGPNNLGFDAARGRYVATLNNDTVPQPGWLAALVEVAESDPRAGSVASRMVFDHAPGLIQSAGITIDRAAIAWDRLVGRPLAEGERAPIEVFGASAGGGPYRRTMLRELGGFDRRYFMYLEDVDLAWRARLAGWRAFSAPAAVVRHAHSASAGEGSPLKNWHLGRNKVWVTAKCYPVPDWPGTCRRCWRTISPPCPTPWSPGGTPAPSSDAWRGCAGSGRCSPSGAARPPATRTGGRGPSAGWSPCVRHWPSSDGTSACARCWAAGGSGSRRGAVGLAGGGRARRRLAGRARTGSPGG